MKLTWQQPLVIIFMQLICSASCLNNSKALQLIFATAINYQIFLSAACTSRGLHRSYGNFNYVAENHSQHMLFDDLSSLSVNWTNTAPKVILPESSNKTTNEKVERSDKVRTDIFDKNPKNFTDMTLAESSVQLLHSISHILNSVATRVFPKLNFNWITNTATDSNNEEAVVHNSASNDSQINEDLEITHKNSSSTVEGDNRRLFTGNALTQLQMVHTDTLNATRALLLPIYSIFKPRDNPCQTGDEKLGEGLCFSAAKCRRLGGQTFGNCFGGKCCVFSKSCGETVREKRALFESPFYPQMFSPSQRPYTCRIKIEKIKRSVCQIHLYFSKFEVRGVDGAVCRRDTFRVTGINNELPPLCGNNTGQHVYLDVDKDQRMVELKFALDSSIVEGRMWSIQIQQLDCEDSNTAPSGCLQYYKARTGIIRSFNYGDALIKATSGYPPGLNYGICIQKFPDSCSLRFEPRGSFQVDASSTGSVTAPPGFICRNDYLLIPNSLPLMAAPPSTFDRFCGSGFPPILRSRSGPYTLQFVSDQTGFKDGGFQLLFDQESC